MLGKGGRALLCAVALASLGACAFTRDQMTLDYAYRGTPPSPLGGEQTKLISSVAVEERRNVDDPRLIMNKRNAYGPTEGGYLAEKPVAEIVRGALLDGFRRAGIRADGGPGQPALRGQLMELSQEILMGFWSGTVNLRMAVRLELVDPASGRVLWNDTFYGRASRSGLQILDEKTIAELFGITLDDLVKQAAESAGMRQQLQARGMRGHGPDA